jgi:outer membrane protein TolC
LACSRHPPFGPLFQPIGLILGFWGDFRPHVAADNPAIKAGENAQGAAEAALREGKGGHYPTLNLNLSAQQSNEGHNNSLAPQSGGTDTDLYRNALASAEQSHIAAEKAFVGILGDTGWY